MTSSWHQLSRVLRAVVFAGVAAGNLNSFCSAPDTELTNYKSGIDVIWGGTKGTDYYEEYLYYDKLLDDHKVVYIRSTTPISMAHNARNVARFSTIDLGFYIIGTAGLAADMGGGGPGIIRYKIDRDRYYWAQRGWTAGGVGGTFSYPYVYPAYSAPFTLASETYDDTPQGGTNTTPVVGTTGGYGIGGAISSDRTKYYFRGIVDSVGDEWHVLSYADDDAQIMINREAVSGKTSYEWASDGKTVLLVVNPKTPCFTARVTGTGQFFTTTPKAYWTPKICEQTTYIEPGTSGTVTIELRDINGNNVFYSINGAGFVNAGAATVTLTDIQFNDGTNSLRYYYNGNAAYTKTRTIVKNPAYPSAGEAHGYKLFVDSANFAAIQSRITREPYSGAYNAIRNRSDFSGQADWDALNHQGFRIAAMNGSSSVLPNAFVAVIEGFAYTRSGAPQSFGLYAKQMLLEGSYNIDPLGYELQHSSDVVPSREINYRGYYDAHPNMDAAFAYDMMIANYKASQVAGGIRPCEDFFIREHLARTAYEAMQWGADMTAMGSPGMWGGSRMTAGVIIGMIMPQYSTALYGTSGFGTVQTHYPICPYETDQYTWKEAMYDANKPRSAFPNLTFYTGWDDEDRSDSSLFLPAGTNVYGDTMQSGDWIDKTAYLTPGMMEDFFVAWYNMAKLYDNRSFGRLDDAIVKLTTGTLRGGKVDRSAPPPDNLVSTQTLSRGPVLGLMNSRFPAAVANNLAWLKSLASSDNNSPNKNMGVMAMSWYDDTATGAVSAPYDAIITITVIP